VIANGLELLTLEEALPDVVLLKLADLRCPVQLLGSHGEREHTLENGQLPVDGPIGRFLSTLSDIGVYVSRSDLSRFTFPEEA
jgi:hypothetical protein